MTDSTIRPALGPRSEPVRSFCNSVGVGWSAISDLIGPSVDDGHNQVALARAKPIPKLEKAKRDRMLYDIAIAWIAARDEDLRDEDDEPSPLKPNTGETSP